MGSVPDEELDVVLGLVLEILDWIEVAAHASEIDERRAMKWEQEIAASITAMSPALQARFVGLCHKWRGGGSYVSDEVLVAIEQLIGDGAGPGLD